MYGFRMQILNAAIELQLAKTVKEEGKRFAASPANKSAGIVILESV